MADYPDLTLISQLEATKNDPTDLEVANKIAIALRQTRKFLATVLPNSFDDDGTLKDEAVHSAAVLKDGVVTSAKLGSGAVDATALGPGSVQETHLATGAVTVNKIGSGAVTNDKIALATIGAGKFVAGAVDTDDLASAAVTSGKLSSSGSVDADRAVGTDHIKDVCITNAKIADKTIEPTKLNYGTTTAGSPKVPVMAGADTVMASIGGNLTAALNTTTDTLEFSYAIGAGSAATTFARIDETATATVDNKSTSAVVSDWNLRQLASVTGDASLVTATGGNVTIKQAGTYLVFFRVPGYSVDRHLAALWDNTNGAILAIGGSAIAPPGQQSDSTFFGTITTDANNVVVQLRHWAETQKTNNGRGVAPTITTAGVGAVYATLILYKVS